MLPSTLLALATAGLVAASPVTLQHYARALAVGTTKLGITAQELSRFKTYTEYAAAAYCNSEVPLNTKIECGGSCPTLEGDGATVVATLGLGDAGKTGIAGYVSVDLARQEVVLAIRGSANIRNWLTNINFGFRNCDLVSRCQVHSGFADAWDEISAPAKLAVKQALAANPGFTFAISGHSLGGAVATLAAAYLRRDGLAADLYTYGSPRVGNDHFVNFVTNQAGGEYRLTHGDDPVPRLPPIIFGYRHTTPEYWLEGPDSTKINYTAGEVYVCDGIANVECNASGPIEIDIDAHGHYLNTISSCDRPGVESKREEIVENVTITDEELKQRWSVWFEADKEYSHTLAMQEQGEEAA